VASRGSSFEGRRVVRAAGDLDRELLLGGRDHGCLRWRKITEAAARWLARAAVARFEYISGIIRTKTAEIRSRRRFAELTGPRALIDAALPAYDPDDAADDRSPDRESGWTR